MSRSSEMRWLAGILLLAVALRVFGLNAPLWYDEIVTLDTHLRLGWAEMMTGYEMNHHYLFNFLAKLSGEAFGMWRPWAIRLPAASFGVLTVWAVWLAARDTTGAKAALAAALLTAISYHEIWFSQNARGYTGLAFLGTLGTWQFLRLMQGRRVPAGWIGYAVVLALSLFTHLTGVFLFAAHGLFWLGTLAFNGNRRVLGPVIGFGAGALLSILLYAPLLPSMLTELTGVSSTSALDVMQEYQNPIWSVIEGLRSALGSAGPVALILGIGVLAVGAIGAVAGGPVARSLGVIVVLHIAVTLVLLSLLHMRIWPRFFFVDIGLVLILLVLGVEAIAGAIRRVMPLPIPWFGVGVAIMVVLSLFLTVRNYVAPKQDLAGAVAFVRATAPPDARVYGVTYSADLINRHFKTHWGRLSSDADLAEALDQPGPVYLVITFPSRAYRLMPALSEAEAQLTLSRRLRGTLGDGNILIFTRE